MLQGLRTERGREVHRSATPDCGALRERRFEPLAASAAEVDDVVALWSAPRGETARGDRSEPRLDPGRSADGGAGRGGTAGPNQDETDAGDARRAAAPDEGPDARKADPMAIEQGGEALRLTGRSAQESAFKLLAPGRRVLHLATHGWFLDERCSTGASSDPSDRAVVTPGSLSRADNPLLLSGLALAGANRRKAAGADMDDGILTAEEIASLDLDGVKWVVLSACETGLGEIRPGEGVLGLRRAFRIAGARSLLLSLWAVQDEVTRDDMRRLYSARAG